MTDASLLAMSASTRESRSADRVRRRNAAEKRFRWYGITAILLALAALVLLIGTVGVRGYTALLQTQIALEVAFSEETLDPTGARDPAVLGRANYTSLIRDALTARFPEAGNRQDRRALGALVSSGADFALREMVLADPGIIGTTQTVWLTAADDVDMLRKEFIERDVDEADRRLTDRQLGWYDSLDRDGAVRTAFNTGFFTTGDSREPEIAGIWGAVVGSFWTMLVTLLLSFPLGVAAALYLEEFAAKTRWTDLIEVNINNLAAVPSIVFGLLGLAVFLNFFLLPRSAPLVGGLVLALMTLPTIIIASRAALKAVPPSIREAALGIGASRAQVVVHHVLPLAMPGVLTGAIIGMARALGETAPLLMVGMVAFIVDVPQGITDPATVLPVQVYLWADSPERAFVEKTAGATLVLLLFLIAMNGLAVFLRKKFERRW